MLKKAEKRYVHRQGSACGAVSRNSSFSSVAARIVDLGAARVAVGHAGARQTSSIARPFHEGEVLIIARLTGPATGVAVRTVAAIEVAERAERAPTVAAAIELPVADRRVLIIRAARAGVRAQGGDGTIQLRLEGRG